MPIVDIELVDTKDEEPGLAQAVADQLAEAWGMEPGKVWVRLRRLPPEHYAENRATAPRPVFVTVLASAPPEGEALEQWIGHANRVVSQLTRRPPDLVHVLFEPAARGRIAFGGRLVK